MTPTLVYLKNEYIFRPRLVLKHDEPVIPAHATGGSSWHITLQKLEIHTCLGSTSPPQL